MEDREDRVVVICGSRAWSNHKTVGKVLSKLPRGTRIRTGGAGGADTMAEWHGRKLGLKVEPSFKPDYQRYGRFGAPKQRNTKMLVAKPRPYKVIAFWDGESTGTLDTIEKACELGIPVEIYTESNVDFAYGDSNDVHIEVIT